MITIKNISNFLWYNRFAEHPILMVEVNYKFSFEWNFGMVNEAARQRIIKKFSTLKTKSLNIKALEFLADLCLAIQQEKFSLPNISNGDENKFYFATLDFFYASHVVSHMASFVNHLINNPNLSSDEVDRITSQLENKYEPAALDQSVLAMTREAKRRNMPWFRVAPNIRDIQLGHGHKQQRMRETISSNEGVIATSYGRDKAMTNRIFNAIGLPVGNFATVTNPKEAADKAKLIGFPVVIKPLAGNKGTDVVVGISTPEAVSEISAKLFTRYHQLLIQSYFAGDDHRILVVSGKFVAVARRNPAHVIADGKSTIEQLVKTANLDPRRGSGFSQIMNYIDIDDEMKRILANQKLSLSSIPKEGTYIKLRRTANIATGGTADDFTDVIHPDNIRLAERAALAIGIKVAGIDFITRDISKSWKEVGGGICEINSSVGLRPHWLSNPNRNVVTPIFNTIFPDEKDNGRIPTALITGSNGKTTTTRMLDHVFRAAGHISGCVTTDGITIDGEVIIEGDFAGAGGTELVLRDPIVTAAALETARGGLLKRGVYTEQCDVAALLNVDNDQVGIDGIETIDQMAELKSNILKAAQKKIILNAEDERCFEMSKKLPVEKVILFALNSSNNNIQSHHKAGGIIVTLNDKKEIIIKLTNKITKVTSVNNIPATFKGNVKHNISNALAATALAYGMGVSAEITAKGLSNFTATIEHSAGRFNLIEDLPALVLFDFANNVPAIKTALNSIKDFSKSEHNICVFTSLGNRPDEQIDNIAKTIAGNFDHYICFERPDWRRGREVGYITNRLNKALIQAGIATEKISNGLSQNEAMTLAAKTARKSSFITVFGTDVKTSIPEIRKAFSG